MGVRRRRGQPRHAPDALRHQRGTSASHHHFGGADRDFPPPIVALEPEAKPADPTAPPQALPKLSPPLDIGRGFGRKHCRTVQVTSSPQALIVVAGGPPTWGDLLQALRDGNVYANAHTVAHPEGEIRGNFYSCR